MKKISLVFFTLIIGLEAAACFCAGVINTFEQSYKSEKFTALAKFSYGTDSSMVFVVLDSINKAESAHVIDTVKFYANRTSCDLLSRDYQKNDTFLLQLYNTTSKGFYYLIPCDNSYLPVKNQKVGEVHLHNYIKQLLTITSSYKNDNGMAIFPNPCKEFIQVDNNVLSVLLHNLEGKLVNSFVTQDNSKIDISNLKSGMYFAKLYASNGSFYLQKVWKE